MRAAQARACSYIGSSERVRAEPNIVIFCLSR
jgi:hypothetical protein